MEKFLVLVEKEYVIGHYVPIVAEDARVARELVKDALETGGIILNDEFPGDAFGRIEEDIEEVADEAFFLNGPTDSAKGVRIADQKNWGRPVVMEEESAISAA